MFWPVAKTMLLLMSRVAGFSPRGAAGINPDVRRDRRAGNRPGLLAVAVLLGFVATGACARPAGRMFEPMPSARVWPSPPESPRIRFVGNLTNSGDLKAARSGSESFARFFRGPRPPISLVGPHAVAVREPGLLAVADAAGAAVHIIDLEARTHTRILGWADQRFGVPVGVSWAEGRLFVTDAGRHEVVELTRDGRFRGRFGVDELQRPVGLVFVPSRRQLYVVDGGAHCIDVFDLAGTLVTRLGREGTAPGEFHFPTHIGLRGEMLAVSDSGNARVQLLDLDGGVQRVIGGRGDAAGDFALPKGVAFDRAGHVYVVDAQFENVQIFNEEGQLLLAFGEEGRGPGEFWLPAGLAIDARDRIWVVDSGNHRIQVFDYIGARL